MAQFIALNPKAEVNGETVYSIVDGMGNFRDRGLKLLKAHGIEDPAPGKWYTQQSWLDAFRAISESTGVFTLLNIGKKIPENAQFPPEIDSINKALAAIDIAYHMNHRIDGVVLFNPSTGKMEEGIGHYGFAPAGDRKIIMTCDNPYPCEFDRGIIESMANKFKPAGAFVKIIHDDSKPCRKKGDDSCTYIVTW